MRKGRERRGKKEVISSTLDSILNDFSTSAYKIDLK